MQHCLILVHRTHHDPHKRGTSLRLKEVARSILAGAVLAGISLSAWAQSPVPSDPTAGPVPQSNGPAAGLPVLTGVGGMNQYEGLTVQRIDFPDLPAASARRLLDLIPQKAGVALQREKVRQSIQSLHSTGRFADIQVEAERSSDQVVLAIRTKSNFF